MASLLKHGKRRDESLQLIEKLEMIIECGCECISRLYKSTLLTLSFNSRGYSRRSSQSVTDHRTHVSRSNYGTLTQDTAKVQHNDPEPFFTRVSSTGLTLKRLIRPVAEREPVSSRDRMTFESPKEYQLDEKERRDGRKTVCGGSGRLPGRVTAGCEMHIPCVPHFWERNPAFSLTWLTATHDAEHGQIPQARSSFLFLSGWRISKEGSKERKEFRSIGRKKRLLTGPSFRSLNHHNVHPFCRSSIPSSPI